MKSPQRAPSLFSNLILLAGLAAIWIAFAPVKMGGHAFYVMVNGLSMEPNYHTGDLVIVRQAETYQVGDVVTYRDAEMNAYVIHRIIGSEQGHLILRGDNNSWVDAYHPTHDEIVGKQWIHAPKAGTIVQWFRKPLNLSLATVLLGGILMPGMFSKPSRSKKGKSNPQTIPGGTLETTLYLLGFLFIGFLGLTIFAFTRPLTRSADKIKYQQEGSYSYSAIGTPSVYDTAEVRSGEPIFPKLTCFLNLGFSYTIPGNQFQNMSGSHQMYARIADEQSGWQRTIPLIPQTPFTGNSYLAIAPLDLCQMTALLNTVEAETGLKANTYTVEIITSVAFTANAFGQVITDTFDPILVLKFDKVHLYLANTNAEIDPLHITKEGLADNPSMQANTLSVLGMKPTLGFIRALALLGLGISFSSLVIIGLFTFNMASKSEEALIRLRYGSTLVDVYEKNLEPTSATIDVTSMDDLAKLAERQGTMILHMTRNFLHYYLVQNNGTTYRYVISAGRKGIVESETEAHFETDEFPAAQLVRLKTQTHRRAIHRKNSGRPRSIQNEVLESAVNHQKNNIIQKQWLVAEEVPQYVIRTSEIEFVMPKQETEMLKRVKL